MVEPADFWDFHDRAVLDNLTLDRALLFERLVIVAKVGGQRPLQVTGIQDDEVVQAFPSYGSDQALGISILPGTLRRCQHLPNP